MFNKNNKRVNKRFNTLYDHANNLAVRCKILADKNAIKNYLINIEDPNGSFTVLLDKDGDSMFSQVKL